MQVIKKIPAGLLLVGRATIVNRVNDHRIVYMEKQGSNHAADRINNQTPQPRLENNTSNTVAMSRSLIRVDNGFNNVRSQCN